MVTQDNIYLDFGKLSIEEEEVEVFDSEYCLEAFQLPTNFKGGNVNVAYIDTEGTFRPDRIVPIAERFGMDPGAVLDNIIYARAYTYEHQFHLLLGLAAKMSEEPFRLLIVDSVIALSHVDFTGRGELADCQQKLDQMLSRMIKIAEEFNVAVYMINQVIADPGGGEFISDPKKPAGGHVLAHGATVWLMFRKGKGEQCVCKVFDAPNLPEAEAISFPTIQSQALYELLAGGIETLAITEAFGELQSVLSGKTQLSRTLCVTTQLPTSKRGGLSSEVTCHGVNAGDARKLPDAGIYTYNGILMNTKKSLTGNKVLSEAKALHRFLAGGSATLAITEAWGDFRSVKTQIAWGNTCFISQASQNSSQGSNISEESQEIDEVMEDGGHEEDHMDHLHMDHEMNDYYTDEDYMLEEHEGGIGTYTLHYYRMPLEVVSRFAVFPKVNTTFLGLFNKVRVEYVNGLEPLVSETRREADSTEALASFATYYLSNRPLALNPGPLNINDREVQMFYLANDGAVRYLPFEETLTMNYNDFSNTVHQLYARPASHLYYSEEWVDGGMWFM